MNGLVNVPISQWYAIPLAVGLLALTFVFVPGALLYLAVKLFPKEHERRNQFIADLEDVPFVKRPFWVAGALVRCLFEGPPARLKWRRQRRVAARVAVTSDVWEDPEMRIALAGREVSTIYRLLRRSGVSPDQIRAFTGQSPSEVSEILNGRRVVAYDVIVRIADGLGIPRGYMGLACDEVTAARELRGLRGLRGGRRRRRFKSG